MTTEPRIRRLKLTAHEEAVVRLALRLLATDAIQDWLDHERGINPDGWSDDAADLYRAVWGEHEGAFNMEAIKRAMNGEALS
jgi:hypothetical protein